MSTQRINPRSHRSHAPAWGLRGQSQGQVHDEGRFFPGLLLAVIVPPLISPLQLGCALLHPLLQFDIYASKPLLQLLSLSDIGEEANLSRGWYEPFRSCR